MTLGPIEVLVIGFPDNTFNGSIVPQVQSLIDRGIIAVVDAVLIRKDEGGEVTFIEFEQSGIDADPALGAFHALMAAEVRELISEDDVAQFAAELEPNSAAAVLVFEHTWAIPFRDAVVSSGGVLLSNIRIPGLVVEEVLAAVASLD